MPDDNKPRVIRTYESSEFPGVLVNVYEPEEEWPEARKEWYTMYCKESRGGSKPHDQFDEGPNDSAAKHIRSKEGEASPGYCGLAGELGGSFINDPYYKQK